MKQAEQTLSQLGIDIKVALKVLIIAAVSGLLAALLDEILGLPTNALRFSFGWMIAALNGITYARIKDNYALPGLIASAVAGLVAFLVWFIVMEIIGGKYGLSYNINVFKAILTGAIVGMIGFGWLWVVRTVPDKLPI